MRQAKIYRKDTFTQVVPESSSGQKMFRRWNIGMKTLIGWLSKSFVPKHH